MVREFVGNEEYGDDVGRVSIDLFQMVGVRERGNGCVVIYCKSDTFYVTGDYNELKRILETVSKIRNGME